MTGVIIAVFVAGSIYGAAGMWLLLKDKKIVHVRMTRSEKNDEE